MDESPLASCEMTLSVDNDSFVATAREVRSGTWVSVNSVRYVTASTSEQCQDAPPTHAE